ncbi:tRNA (uridine(34)/cytosine(34)/5-carboxymethylaminomethyluridine(34)-2'-O)-methyltransferase TrmL [Nitrosomonas oligotropha]|uniref:tRNA (cytidine(34)-2'-O)-methyltransferase n=1 Tax=Nitrosomonas oligotropha TaxID=42354 RepID=A0A1H8NFU3_9PROT|nr:tRNA (uridine(34)/cytosine(34)/5-carboxymethylaminomethyluridine(34)-2'-O)-methyltransferase TrmL [Nitrosomonas oligotropha]SDW95703.1 tRNA (cytidine/uridine-2'-O-)-methyltransferase [Nitrosomonas oligotropha]SEO28263.1 tRNA (cytidine/uridine-2'-O-)-methyltransferase [Nitrosomonas oligotropha]
MFHIVLHQPEIPPNTGNIIRLCANTGSQLHLVKPLGFPLQDKQLIRAGLDYHEFASIKVHEDWTECSQHLQGQRLFAITTKGKPRYDSIAYAAGDVFLFGSESCGLPAHLMETIPEQQRIRVPMLATSRSLNLSNAVAIVVYEAWRQIGFPSGQ